MKSNKVLLRAYRRDPEEFRGFVNEVRSNCRDAGYDRSYVAHIAYDHFAGLERRSLKEIQRKYQEDIDNGHSERYAWFKGTWRLVLRDIKNTLKRDIEKFGHKKIDYDLIKFQAERNRRYLENPVLAEKEDNERRERIHSNLNRQPPLIRIILKPMLYLDERKHGMK